MNAMIEALLKQMTTPLVPQIGEAGTAVGTSMAQPGLAESENPTMAKVKGFAGGAIEGLGNLASDATSPLSLMGMLASGGMSKAGEGIAAGATAAGRAAPEIMGLTAEQMGRMNAMHKAANPVFKAMEAAGQFGGERTVRGVAPVAKQAAELGTRMAEFTPQGGEDAYNALKPVAAKGVSLVDQMYSRLLAKGGR
jgi:hypothetical protein